MTREQYQRLIPLFLAAMDLPTAERWAFARARCSDDSQLFKDLLALLQAAPEQPSEGVSRSTAPLNNLSLFKYRPSRRLVIDRFQIIRCLGRGGMGKVYQAVDRENGGVVALKLIRTRGAFSEDQRMRFLREARSAATLLHPNIVEIYDIGQVEGHLYLVMEYLEGKSLRALIRDGPLSAQLCVRVIAQIARALAFAHAKGVMHGDIKPDNIMVLNNGSAKLLDFGVARNLAFSDPLIKGGGTLAYMAPERFASPEATILSDVWSLGITLFESLSGALPFHTVEEIKFSPAQHLTGDSTLIQQLNLLIAHTLAKKSDERPSRTDTIAEVLELLYSENFELPPGRTPPPGLAGETARQSEHATYELPELGFMFEAVGDLHVTTGLFSWAKRRRLFLEKRDRWLDALRSPFFPVGKKPTPLGNAVLTILLAVEFFAGAWIMALGLPRSADLFMARAMKIFLFVIVPSWVFILFLRYLPAAMCSWLGLLDRLVRCRRCGACMRRTSSWARFAKDRAEVIYGYSDCMAALKHGLWQEAVKLLAIHGREFNAAYANTLIAPARYSLDFFECSLCADHAARLCYEDRHADAWRARESYFLAYWCGSRQPFSARTRIPHLVTQTVRATADAVRVRVRADRF